MERVKRSGVGGGEREEKNTQNILLCGCYLLFEEYLQKNSVYILKLCKNRPSEDTCSMRGDKLVKNFKTF